MKFLHAADIHLDSKHGKIARYDDAPVERIKGAPRKALANLVDLAIEESVDFVLIAGDLYDGDWDEYKTGQCFCAQMSRLDKENIPVVMILGNHDAQSQITKSLQLPGNVRQLSHEQPQTIRGSEIGVNEPLAIHGWSFATAAETRNLAAEYPRAISNAFNIGLLHTSLVDSSEHERYAPCSIQDLHGKQYDYWALGHVHTRQMVPERRAKGDPIIAYPGNIQGRHIRETGAKGCLLVDVDSNGNAHAEFRSLDVYRWEHCLVDASGAESSSEVIERFAAGLRQLQGTHPKMPLAVRVTISGRTAVHLQLSAYPEKITNEIRNSATTESSGDVWVEDVRLETKPEIQSDSPVCPAIDEINAIVDEWCSADIPLEAINATASVDAGKELVSLRGKLPTELWDELDDDDGDPLQTRQMLPEAAELLKSRLLESEDAS